MDKIDLMQMQKNLPVIHVHFLSTMYCYILLDSKVKSMNRNVIPQH